MCDKVVNTYPSTIKYVPKCYKTQEMCNKTVNSCFFVFDSIPDRYKTHEMSDRVVSEDLFLIVYCPDQYVILINMTQKMCDKAVDYCPAALKLIPDWFVTSKMIKNFLLLCTEMKIYSTLKKIMVILYFLVMKWAFLI